MKIILVGKDEKLGGAAKAANNWNTMLRQNGLETEYFVETARTSANYINSSNGRFVKFYNLVKANLSDFIVTSLYKNKKPYPWSINIFPSFLSKKINNSNADIIHLHWVCRETISWREIYKINKPIVWTMHDMWAMTGGCNYTYGCNKYLKHCGDCPQLESNKKKDLSFKRFEKNLLNLKNKNITVITCSKWLGDCFKSSPIFQNFNIHVIPNPIDTNQYRPLDSNFAKKLFGLDTSKKTLLFMAFSATSDVRKGFQFIPDALKELESHYQKNEIEILVVGDSRPTQSPQSSFKVHFTGHLYDELSIILALNAADVLIAPSTEENLSNAVMESLSCGTPVVAFNIGGMSDMIRHLENGYLAKPFDAKDLAIGISKILSMQISRDKLNSFIEKNFGINNIYSRAYNLYNQIISEKELQNEHL